MPKAPCESPKHAWTREPPKPRAVTKREAAGACFFGAITGSALGSLGPASLVQFLDLGPSAVTVIAIVYGAATLFSFIFLLLVTMVVGMPVIRHLTSRVSTHYPLLFSATGAALALIPISPFAALLGWKSAALDALFMVAIAGGYGASTGLGIGLALRYPRLFR